MVEALLGGTTSMRDAGEMLLPKWPDEEPESYKNRLATATLYPAFSRTVGVMSGKPFAKPATLSDNTPAQIAQYCENVDLEGRNLHAFTHDMLREALAFGLCGVLVDYPTTVGQVKTLADERAIGARPYFVPVTHKRILGWKTQRVNGVLMLSELRLAECDVRSDGAWGETEVKRVRVLRPGSFELYEEQQNTMTKASEYVLIDQGVTTIDIVPFVPFYGRRLAFMMGESPLIDLAHQNVKHWNSQSDQDTILHVARVPILAVIGVDEDNWKLSVGASAAVRLPAGAEIAYVEHTGKAITAGKEALADLEQQMIQTGAELLVTRPGQRSATESNNEADANKSELLAITEQFEDSIDACLQLMAKWVNLPEGGNCTLYKDFSAAMLSDASAQLVKDMQQGGLITKKTAIREQQRRGVLSADIDADDEVEAVNQEGPALGMMGDIDPETGLPRQAVRTE